MGRVYLAEDSKLGRKVAIKVIRERLSSRSQSQERFLSEARAMAIIEHPNIVQIHEYGDLDGRPYLVMQYVEGESLAQCIRRDGPINLQETLRLLAQTVEGLQAAWETGIVHRDLKPANILLDRKKSVRIADFGLAKLIRAEDTGLPHKGVHVRHRPIRVP